jgi:hypothetical protein
VSDFVAKASIHRAAASADRLSIGIADALAMPRELRTASHRV